MYPQFKITDIYAREILDSRGTPTLEVEVLVDQEICGVASVPSGASTGKYEAVELRDRQSRYNGLGVQQAVYHVNEIIAPALIGMQVFDQVAIDRTLLALDGTNNKSNLGANALLGVSMACIKTSAKALRLPLYRYIGGIFAQELPTPMMNILNGGKHAKNSLDFQEFMIVPRNTTSFQDALRMGTEVYLALKTLLETDKKSTAVGDEGGFAPDLKDVFETFDYLTRAVEKAGYQTGKDICFAMDAAASELYNMESGLYVFEGEGKMLTPDSMIDLYQTLLDTYPLISIEDALDEEDWDGWAKLTKQIGNRCQLVGDDLFVTNPKRLQKGISMGCANCILIKPNQIGTISETLKTIQIAQKAGYRTIISHRSGETEDTMIADLAVGVNAGQIKTGAPCRGERVAKYNQLLRIEDELI